MHTVLPSSICPIWGIVSQERRSLWFRLPGTIHVTKREHPKAVWSQPLCQSFVVLKRYATWLPHLSLNPSANLPLQPHFRLLPQLVTAASIPGRCGPVVWCQLSPSSSGPHYKSLFGAPLLAAPYYTLTRN